MSDQQGRYPGLIAPASLKQGLVPLRTHGGGLSGVNRPGLIEAPRSAGTAAAGNGYPGLIAPASLKRRMGQSVARPSMRYPGLIAPASLKRSSSTAVGVRTSDVIRG